MFSPAIPTIPSYINIKAHRLEQVFNDGKTDFDEKYKSAYAYDDYIPILYNNYQKSLDFLFSNFMSNNSITCDQLSVLNRVLSYLQSFISQDPILLSDVKLDKASDDEVVIYRKSNKGIYDIVIDIDGDSMVSFSGYKEKGWRQFYEKDELNPPTHISDFFSI